MAKLYIGNVDKSTDKKELECEFAKFGALREVWVARHPPGFAFVEFEDERDAEDAIREMDDKNVCGSRIRVEWARSTGRKPAPRTDTRRRSRSPPRSGGQRRKSPPPRRRSPSPRRRSPSPRRRSPSPRSPPARRRSPSPRKRSPSPRRRDSRSPGRSSGAGAKYEDYR